MLRTEALDIVSRPGKFEGCAPYVPHFWEAYLEGLADDDDGAVLRFDVTLEDVAEFPELADVESVFLAETDCGSVVECDGMSDDPSEGFASDDA